MAEDFDTVSTYYCLREAGEQLALFWRAGRALDILEKNELIAYKDNSDMIIEDAVKKINDALGHLAPVVEDETLEHKPILMEF
ncbi:MAG: hypothetical protein ISS65_08700 [Desulfobacterales bacterium]|uniref:Uncharacterized protein n=1 Tax=Candidatus Desulfatibia profunda TaxID=2841695 RepID=A0A8J6NKL7_9BACT|nr:hypothetical protein [Candidatus Desulfatibia profunda]MBL7180269.1 hypothetical protein [Desulfobacterales bacterium]